MARGHQYHVPLHQLNFDSGGPVLQQLHARRQLQERGHVIELLLWQPLVEQDAEGDMLVHNAVRAGVCPPDLLRYIVAITTSFFMSILLLDHSCLSKSH